LHVSSPKQLLILIKFGTWAQENLILIHTDQAQPLLYMKLKHNSISFLKKHLYVM